MTKRSIAILMTLGVLSMVLAGIACRALMLHKRGQSTDVEPRRPSRFLDQVNGCMDIEANTDYRGAIGCYTRALRDVDVFPGVRVLAETAAHNRIATCYWKLGDRAAAIKEFDVSLKLGDKKFAAKAIARIRRGDPPPRMKPVSAGTTSTGDTEPSGT